MAATIITLPKLEPWQEEVFDSMLDSRGSGKIYCVVSKRQIGKTILAIVLLIKFALEQKSVSVCVEPTQAQSRRVFKQIVDCLEGSGAIVSANSTLLTIQFANGSEILFKSAEQREALRGYSVSGLMVIDEGAFIPSDIYAILYPTCDANKAPILIISTPLFRNGEFYEVYMRGINGSERVMSFNWGEYDTSKYLSSDTLEYYRQTLPPLKFQSEYLGQFISEGSYIFGDIGKCISPLSTRTPVYGGIDWGTGNGGDFTVVVLLDSEGVVVRIEAFSNLGAVEQVERIAALLGSYPTLKAVNVEINSIGSVFYDNLRAKMSNPACLRKFNTTNDTKRDIIEELISAFQTQKISIPQDEELIRELQHYSVEKTAKGYTYNGSDGVHDDYCMALAFAWWARKKNNGDFRLVFV